MTGETPEARSDKRKPREEREDEEEGEDDEEEREDEDEEEDIPKMSPNCPQHVPNMSTRGSPSCQLVSIDSGEERWIYFGTHWGAKPDVEGRGS